MRKENNTEGLQISLSCESIQPIHTVSPHIILRPASHRQSREFASVRTPLELGLLELMTQKKEKLQLNYMKCWTVWGKIGKGIWACHWRRRHGIVWNDQL